MTVTETVAQSDECDREDVKQLLASCGYRHATIYYVGQEGQDVTVALFTIPHKEGKQRAFTAFIAQEDPEDFPIVEVEPGFLVS